MGGHPDLPGKGKWKGCHKWTEGRWGWTTSDQVWAQRRRVLRGTAGGGISGLGRSWAKRNLLEGELHFKFPATVDK